MYGLNGSERLLERSTVKEIGSAVLQELCEQEEEEEGLALQRNREAREVQICRDDADAKRLHPIHSQKLNMNPREQVLSSTRHTLQNFATMFSVGYRKINEAQAHAHRCLPHPCRHNVL